MNIMHTCPHVELFDACACIPRVHKLHFYENIYILFFKLIYQTQYCVCATLSTRTLTNIFINNFRTNLFLQLLINISQKKFNKLEVIVQIANGKLKNIISPTILVTLLSRQRITKRVIINVISISIIS